MYNVHEFAPQIRLAFDTLSNWSSGQPAARTLTPTEREFMARRRIETVFEDLSAPTDFQHLYRDVYRTQLAAVKAVMADLATLNVPSRLYKGAAIVETCLNGEPLSIMRDMDLIVPPEHISLVRAILRQHNFSQGVFDLENQALIEASPEKIAQYEQGSYELFAYSRIAHVPLPQALSECVDLWQRAPIWKQDDKVLVLVTLDIHTSAATDIPRQYLWSGDPEAKFIEPSVEAWLLATRYYLELAENKKRPVLRDLFYLARLIPKADLQTCLELARRHHTLPAFYYTYQFLKSLGMPGEGLDSNLMISSDRKNDFGWQFGKLTGDLDRFTRRSA